MWPEIKMFRFESLLIWKAAIGFSKDVYKLTKELPKEEIFALGDQLRRASVSISANIAEGSGSSTTKDFKNYLSISIKSSLEVVSLLMIAKENDYISEQQLSVLYNQAEILIKQIRAFKNSLL